MKTFRFHFQLSFHKFNESQREQTVLKRLKQGEIVALISDAGTPGISDPGTELVSMLYNFKFNYFIMVLLSIYHFYNLPLLGSFSMCFCRLTISIS